MTLFEKIQLALFLKIDEFVTSTFAGIFFGLLFFICLLGAALGIYAEGVEWISKDNNYVVMPLLITSMVAIIRYRISREKKY